MTAKSKKQSVIRFVAPDGTEILDKKMIKLSNELEVLTRYFTQKVKETADRHGVKLVTHVQFEGVNPQKSIKEDI